MLFLVMVHVKKIGVILSHWDYWGLYIITIMKFVGVVLGLLGIILLQN